MPRHDDRQALIAGFLDERLKVWYLPRNAVEGLDPLRLGFCRDELHAYRSKGLGGGSPLQVQARRRRGCPFHV